MGLMDMVGGMLGGNTAQAGATQGSGGQAALVQAVLGMLTQGQGQGGGIGNLVQAFEQHGLGHILDSWVGTGQNLPITTDQITKVLGQGNLTQLAQQTGMQHSDIVSALTQLLPKIIDHATPQGQLPAGGGLGNIMSIAKQLLG